MPEYGTWKRPTNPPAPATTTATAAADLPPLVRMYREWQEAVRVDRELRTDASTRVRIRAYGAYRTRLYFVTEHAGTPKAHPNDRAEYLALCEDIGRHAHQLPTPFVVAPADPAAPLCAFDPDGCGRRSLTNCHTCGTPLCAQHAHPYLAGEYDLCAECWLGAHPGQF